MTLEGEEGPPGRATSERPGDVIDRYKLLQQIGEGGFGVVYMAEQEQPVRRRVALKVIKLGMDTRQVIARFEAERQALAMMDHANIAKVLDAGATETGRPYFVMELVKGEPITHYCDRNNLSVRERLAIFQLVCHAVQHAHQKGIIHRDLKPSNVLITLHDGRPVPKVIDFGIAKATSARLTEKTLFTEYHQFIGTPAYMSPEQAELSGLDIDTRSDVYSLGVLLYELLTGTTPFDVPTLLQKGFDELQRVIREETPHKPSTRLSTLDTLASVAAQRHTEPRKLGLMIRGDLDWIVMKALEKDRTRRYETASGFAADIQHYLDDEPVVAGPPSASYRFQKYVKRHWGQVLAAGTVAAALVLGLLGTTWQARIAARRASDALEAGRAAEAARLAEAERADELKRVSDFQSRMLSEIDATQAGIDLLADVQARFGAALERAGLPADERARQEEALRAQLVRVNATDAAAAMIDRTILRPAVAAIDAEFVGQPLVDAQLRQTLADLYRSLGMYDEAWALQSRALDTRRRTLGATDPATLRSLEETGDLLLAQGKLDEADSVLHEALETCRRVLGEEQPETLLALENVGDLLVAQGKLAEAEQRFREVLEKRRRVSGEEAPETLDVLASLGGLLEDMGELGEAEEVFREALEKTRHAVGEDHRSTLICLGNLGTALQLQGKFVEAEPVLREALEGQRRVFGGAHPTTLVTLVNLGTLLQDAGKLGEAEPILREAVQQGRRVLGEDHTVTLKATSSLADLLLLQGRHDEAEEHSRQALMQCRRVLGEEHPLTLHCLSLLGDVLYAQGHFDEAEPYLREALEKSRRVLGPGHTETRRVVDWLGNLLRVQGRFAEAERVAREALEACRRSLGEDDPATLGLLANYGSLLVHEGKRDAAEPYVREALEGRRRVLGDEHASTLDSAFALGALLAAKGELDEAADVFIEALQACQRATTSPQPIAAKLLHHHAEVLRALGWLEEAAGHASEAMRMYREHPGWSLGEAAHAASILRSILEAQGATAEALAVGGEWLALRRQLLPAASAELADDLASYSAKLLKWGRLADANEAVPLLRECLEVRAADGPADWRVSHARSLLGGALLLQVELEDGLAPADREQILSEAEGMLLDGYAGLAEDPRLPAAEENGGADLHREALQRVVRFYEVREESEPGRGHDTQAAFWKAKLDSHGR